jgi:glycosyltransferase involved in cell wall biosynthesis
MRILYGITKSNWGGAQRYVFDLATSARERGHDVAVLCGGEGALVEKLRQEGISVISLPGLERDINILKEFKNFFGILRILKREKPDIFHINSSKMGGIGALAGRLARIKKIIFTAHGWAFREERHWAENLLIEEASWLTVMLCHRTICVSKRDFDDMAKKPLAGKKLVLIHNGVGEVSFHSKAKAREKLALVTEAEVVGTIAELHHNKGLDTALRGFSGAYKYTDTKLVVIGEGEERAELESLVGELGLGEQVSLVGFKDEASRLLKAFDIFILPSRKEGLPYSLLEAGLASLPVVATKVGGIPEVIRDGETGLLIQANNPDALAKALLKLKDEQLRKSLGKNLHTLVSESFSKEKMVAETLKQY